MACLCGMNKRAEPAPAPVKTKTQPDGEREGLFEGPDPVTWLHIFGTGHHFQLPRDRKVFTIGSSSECDIAIALPHVSRLHCRIERHYDCLRVEDHSKNGTWFDERLIKEPKDVRPGNTFAIPGGITFIALNDEMRAAYPIFSDILDREGQETLIADDKGWVTPSKLLVWASGSDHLLVLGPRGCDQDRLARAIHSISPVRSREMVWVDSIPTERAGQKDLLLRASKSTLVLNIDKNTPVMDAAFRASLFSTSFRVRVLVIAPAYEHVLRVLGPDHAYIRRVEVRPLAYRIEQLGPLLDRQLDELGSSLRFQQLTEANRQALTNCEWRRNFEDLRVAAERLAALHQQGTLRKAAAALGIKNFNNLQNWFTNTMGLEEKPFTLDHLRR